MEDMPAIRCLLREIIYRVSALRSQFSKWPAGSVYSVLSYELNGQVRIPPGHKFFVGWLGLVGLGLSIRVSVTVQGWVSFHGKKAFIVFCDNNCNYCFTEL